MLYSLRCSFLRLKTRPSQEHQTNHQLFDERKLITSAERPVCAVCCLPGYEFQCLLWRKQTLKFCLSAAAMCPNKTLELFGKPSGSQILYESLQVIWVGEFPFEVET
jgi:hypothetical protein